MIFRKAKNAVAVAILAATPLLTVLTPGIAHALPSAYCEWTGAGSDAKWSTVANWTNVGGGSANCSSSAAPGAGDDLVFPTDTATSWSPINDLTAGTSFNSITFSGTGGTHPFDITGSSITLAGDLTDTSDQGNVIENDVAITGSTTVNVANQVDLKVGGTVSGSGSITKTGNGDAVMRTLTLTGALTINGGMFTSQANSSADLTVSSVAIVSGATFAYNPFDFSSTATYTIAKPITTAGTINFSTVGSAVGTNDTVNITGTMTLTGNASIVAVDGETVNIQGPLHGPGFVLGASTGSVVNQSTDNTTDTPSGELVPAASSSDGSDGTTAPDTGFALVSAHPGVTLAITLAAAGALFGAAQLSRKASARR